MLTKSLVMCCGFVLVSCSKGRDGRFLSFNFEDRDITDFYSHLDNIFNKSYYNKKTDFNNTEKGKINLLSAETLVNQYVACVVVGVSKLLVRVYCHRLLKRHIGLQTFQQRVDLDFSIPFISIPVKKTADSFGISELPTVNINPASLLLGGVIILGTTILLPLVMKHYVANSNPDYRISRILDNTEFGADAVINFANKMVTDGNSLQGCTLRIACWTAQRQDDNLMRTVVHITNNKLVATFVNSTALDDAMSSGRSGRDCSRYSPCPVRQQYIPILLNNLSALTKPYEI